MGKQPQQGELGAKADRFYLYEQGDPHYFERLLQKELYERTVCGLECRQEVLSDILAAWADTAETIWKSCQANGNPEPVIVAA